MHGQGHRPDPLNHQPSNFIGRQQEITDLKAVLEDALSGRGRMVTLVGEPGIGKTRTAEELATYAMRRGAQVLWGHCYEDVGAPPYWPWVQAIRSYVRERDPEQLRSEMGAGAADIAEIVSDVRERLPDLEPAPPLEDPEQARFRLFDSIAAFLKGASAAQPMVVMLDDLHWADRPSLLLLRFLGHEIEGSRLLVLGTYRDTELSRKDPLAETLAELATVEGFDRLVLRGLDQGEVRTYIRGAVGVEPSHELLVAVSESTEGNPLFVTEVVRLLVEEESIPLKDSRRTGIQSVPIPEGIRNVIGKRLNRLTEDCYQTLAVASVVAREFGLDELAEVVGADSQVDLAAQLDQAEDKRLIEELPGEIARYQFTHALIRRAIYDEIASVHRRKLHFCVGESIEDLYAPSLEPHLEKLAHHFFQAASVGGAHKATDYAQRAAERSLTQLAYEQAARLYQMAIVALERADASAYERRCALLGSLANSRAASGDFAEAMKNFEQAADLADKLGASEELAQAAIGFEFCSQRARTSYSILPAVQIMERAVARLDNSDSSLRSTSLGSLARAYLYSGDEKRGMQVARHAVQTASRVGDPGALAAALNTMLELQALGPPDKIAERLVLATEMLSAAQQSGNKVRSVEAVWWRLYGYLEGADIRGVDKEIHSYKRLARETRLPYVQYCSIGYQAMRALIKGKFVEGEDLALRALTLGRRLRAEHAEGAFATQMFIIRREQGRIRELAPVVASFVDQQSEDATWLPGLAVTYIELGFEGQARSVLDRLASGDFAGLPRDGLWLTSLAYLSEVAAFLGDQASASKLYHLLEPYAGHNVIVGGATACLGPASRFLGLLANATGSHEKAERHFQNAQEVSTRMGALPWLAHTEHEYSTMLLARGKRGDRTKALSLLERCDETATTLGMATLKDSALSMKARWSGRQGNKRKYPDSLTRREVEVLGLIASGKTNRDIAGQLAISENTVARHISNIFNKCDVANRAEATAYAMVTELADGRQ